MYFWLAGALSRPEVLALLAVLYLALVAFRYNWPKAWGEIAFVAGLCLTGALLAVAR